MAKLHFNHGPMNSGKSVYLLSAAYQYEQNGKRTLLIKPQTDTKGGDTITSRIGLERKVDLLVPPGMDVRQEIESANRQRPIACVFADEAQFLEPEQVAQLHSLTLPPSSIPVMAYGLRTDFLTHGFPGSMRLMELADVIREIRTICECGKNATFNARTLNGEYTTQGSQVAIDGEAEIAYKSLCGVCYTEKVGPIS